jgi:hypothetical protein
MKTTTNGRRPQSIKSGISQQIMIGSFSNFKIESKQCLIWRRPSMEDDLQWKTTSNGRRPPMEDDLQWKTTSNGRQPQSIEREIFQQPQIGSFSNFKMEGKNCLIWRQPPMEFEYLTTTDWIFLQSKLKLRIGSYSNFKLRLRRAKCSNT